MSHSVPHFSFEQKVTILLLVCNNTISFHSYPLSPCLTSLTHPRSCLKNLEVPLVSASHKHTLYKLCKVVRPQWASLCTFACRLLFGLCALCVCVCLFSLSVLLSEAQQQPRVRMPSLPPSTPIWLLWQQNHFSFSSMQLWWWVTLTPLHVLFFFLFKPPQPRLPLHHNLIAEHSPISPPRLPHSFQMHDLSWEQWSINRCFPSSGPFKLKPLSELKAFWSWSYEVQVL